MVICQGFTRYRRVSNCLSSGNWSLALTNQTTDKTMPIRAHPSNLYEDLPALQRPQTHNDYEERLDAQNPYEIDVQKIPNMTAEVRQSGSLVLAISMLVEFPSLRRTLPSGNEF